MIEIEVSQGVFKRAADLPSQFTIKTVTDADYVILTNDGYDVIFVSTGSIDRTITLPAVANNSGRKIFIMKIDSGSGKVIVDGNEAEKIVVNGKEYVSRNLSKKSKKIDVLCDGTQWWQTIPSSFFGW